MNAWSTVRRSGPLAPYVDRFVEGLLAKGYTELSTAEYLRLMIQMSRWMAKNGVEAVVLTDAQLRAYCDDRHAAGYTSKLTPRVLGRLRDFLKEAGVPAAEMVETGADKRPELLDRYETYLQKERGLVEAIVARWVKAAGLFLADHPGLSDGERAIDAADVTAFCARELPRRGSSAAKDLAAALRSFLRFLHVRGLIAAPLAQAIPPVASRKSATLPVGPSAATVEQLIASCDRRTRQGRRDRAILLLLARLGLRAGEAARLKLDDIDWRVGEIVVRGKGRKESRLPLPSDVGTAIADYLGRGRPTSEHREIFLRLFAPLGPLTPERVTGVVYDACDRAGVPKVGAHRLRHALASRMLGAGASLPEVGQVLRHGALLTTSIYAISRELHQPQAKAQVTCSRRRLISGEGRVVHMP